MASRGQAAHQTHNTWRDFIAAAQYLVNHRYTSPAHLAGEGGSAGGITIGRAITERPDLFGAALDDVGLSDALRVELSPNGPPNIPEFGSTKTPEGYQALYEMSSYHHVKDGTRYPAVMVVTGINDPRVAPWEPAKMAARLQAGGHFRRLPGRNAGVVYSGHHHHRGVPRAVLHVMIGAHLVQGLVSFRRLGAPELRNVRRSVG